MLAVSRTIKDDRLAAFEFLRIVERDGGLVYIAQPNGRPPTEFVLTGMTADSATFENPAHDFPKMIRYTAAARRQPRSTDQRRGRRASHRRLSSPGRRPNTDDTRQELDRPWRGGSARDFPPVLQALWHDGHGDWNAAHEVAQDVPDPDGALVHAYLHRKEGDAGNAAYWYRRASQPVCRESLERAEWEAIVTAFLSRL